MLEAEACARRDLPYVDYTSEQNALMHETGHLLRFLIDTDDDVATLRADLPRLLSGEWDLDQLTRRGAIRAHTHPDPTTPEARFESAFIDAFGESALFALEREYATVDLRGAYRPVDYVLHRRGGSIAIELNGEQFHHPAVIGAVSYRSQLLKQNSLVAMGLPVFRWSLVGMRDTERFIEELRRFFGAPGEFNSQPRFCASRSVAWLDTTTQIAADTGLSYGLAAASSTESAALDIAARGLDGLALKPHQTQALALIAAQRSAGRNCFLVVLPTGTGKTEIAIADFHARKRARAKMNGLFLVPTRQLRIDTLARLAERLPQFVHSEHYQPPHEQAGFTVQTYAQLGRQLAALGHDAFDYMVVDEAHHIMAPGLGGRVRHFSPDTLLGLTATPERLDARRLDDVFGTFETHLSLEDAIRQGVIPPVRAFRVQTNVDLREVRFRGKDYVAADLQRTVVVPSRDRVIADVLWRYFGARWKGGGMLVFCVSVDHARTMAGLLRERGFRAAAVSGQEPDQSAEHVAAYRARRLQVLCACSLLSEGFDAPETSVVVMARPTLSKALYVQQLGRGTRWADGKEALYVIDVVDRYGPLNAPWSVHGLFGVSQYAPFANVLRADGSGRESAEQAQLVDLLEYERRIEEIDVFTFERQYKDYLSDEQMARALYVSTDTLRKWVRKGEVQPEVSVPFGRKAIHYYASRQVGEVRRSKNLGVHDETTLVEDFFAFLQERNYTFSYKPSLLLALLKHVDARGGADLDSLTREFQAFYLDRLRAGLAGDKPGAAMASSVKAENLEQVRRCLLDNPFEKFERKRFMHHAADLSRIELALPVWAALEVEGAAARVRIQMLEDLAKYFEPLGGIGDREALERRFPLARHLANQTRSAT